MDWRGAEKNTRKRLKDIGLGMERVPGSGCGTRKGDSRSPAIMVEDKFTKGLGFRVTRDMLSKAEAQAFRSGARIALICLTFENGPRVYIVDGDRMEEWLERLVERGELE